MDPNATLKELREISARLLDGESESPDGWANDAMRLAELVEAMDSWLTKGGLQPTDWSSE